MKKAKVCVVVITVLLLLFVRLTIAGALTYEEAVPLTPIIELEAQKVIWDESPRVDVDHYVYYSALISEGTTLTVSIRTDGEPVDLFLMDSAGFDEYQALMQGQTETFHYYVKGSAKNVVQKSYTFTIPKTDRFYIVIDNTLTGIEGEAYAGVPVNVHVKVTEVMPTPTPTPPGFGVALAIASLLAVAYLVLGKRKQSKKKED